RTKHEIYFSFKKLIVVVMFIGIILNLTYFMFVILQLDPWYNPQFFIPIGGMIIGKTMTGVSLGVNHLLTGMQDRNEQIEGALMQGASPKRAAKSIVDYVLDRAWVSTFDEYVGCRVVYL